MHDSSKKLPKISTWPESRVWRSATLLEPVNFDVMKPLHAYDAGGRARAATAVVQALALAKEAGVDADEALKLVNWEAD